MARVRLDAELVRRRLTGSRAEAKALIEAGRVKVGGGVVSKPASQVQQFDAIEIVSPPAETYVSRGAYKLLGALEAFAGDYPPIEGAKCLDAGASTGGFTDVLLREGAAEVVAVDVGYGQLDWSLRSNPKVKVLERTNIRYLTPQQVGSSPTLVVADLSFISLTLVLPALVRCAPEATMILMVKPQFEVGKGKVGSGGVVRDAQLRIDAVAQVADAATSEGLTVAGVAASPLPGPSGNVEYFLLLKPASQEGLEDVQAAIAAAVAAGPQDGLTS